MAGNARLAVLAVAVRSSLVVGTLTGTVVELAVIRRLFKSPRVIVLVATIGVAQLCEAVTLALPDYRTGSLQTQFPLPFDGAVATRSLDIEVTASQLLVLIVVPLITVGLWWLLGHTAFGDAVRAASTNSDLARMTGINPKLVSTGVWAIAGFLGTVGHPAHRHRADARPTSCTSGPTRCCAAWPRR